jgi:hypothetical protein
MGFTPPTLTCAIDTGVLARRGAEPYSEAELIRASDAPRSRPYEARD